MKQRKELLIQKQSELSSSYGPRHEKACPVIANNKGADQPAHPHSVIIVFVICLLESFISKLAIYTVSIHCAPEMSEIDCIGRIESFWPKFVRGW